MRWMGIALACVVWMGSMAQDAQAQDRAATLAKLKQAKLDLTLKDPTPLRAVVKVIADAAGVPVAIDGSVFENMAESELAIRMTAKDLTAQQALDLVCKLANLEWAVVGNAVKVQGRWGKPAVVTTRRFYVGDLALALRHFPGPPLGMGYYAHPPRYRLGLPFDGRYRLGYPYSSRHLRVPHGDYYYGRDLDAVPLGAPHYESVPTFQRPPYQGRSRHAPFQQENLGEIQALVSWLTKEAGGESNWKRPGVGINLDRGSVLVITHTPATVQRIAEKLAERRRKPAKNTTYPMKLR